MMNGNNIQDSKNTPSIPASFAGKCIFITGGTGFLGKVVIEKLLRCCPDLRALYVFIRNKKQLSATERWNNIVQSVLFKQLRELYPKRLEKVHLMKGDISADDLGLNQDDSQMLISEVNIVIHCAATVKFNEHLRNAIQMNLVGTKKVIDLCSQMTNLQVLLYVSTCYANCDQDTIMEKVYEQRYNPDQILHLLNYHDEILTSLTSTLLGYKPNTYTFTKSMAELIIKDFEQKSKCQVAIVRPSIITAAAYENPGWVETYSGATGLFASAACGVHKIIHVKKGHVLDLIPVDIVSNTILAAVWSQLTHHGCKLSVFNCASRGRAPYISTRKLTAIGDRYIKKIPFESAIRYPKLRVTSNEWLYQTSMFFQHFLPAILLDFVLRLCGLEGKFVKMYRMIRSMHYVLRFFLQNDFNFETANVEHLKGMLLIEDSSEFRMDISTLDWEEYTKIYVRGIRQHVVKEKGDGGQKRIRLLFIVNLMKKIALLAIVLSVGVIIIGLIYLHNVEQSVF